jgi:hypothetical protein
MEFQEQNEYYVVKGWFEKTNGMHQGAFYGAVATPDNYLQPKRVVVNGEGATAASEAASQQPAQVYPSELLKEQDAGGLNPKEREDTGHMLLDREKKTKKKAKRKAKKVAAEMTGAGAIGAKMHALGIESPTNTAKFGMSDRGGHGDIDNLGKGKRVRTGRKKGKGVKDAKGLTGFGDKAFMPTISQSGGRRGGNKF